MMHGQIKIKISTTNKPYL